MEDQRALTVEPAQAECLNNQGCPEPAVNRSLRQRGCLTVAPPGWGALLKMAAIRPDLRITPPRHGTPSRNYSAKFFIDRLCPAH